MAIPTLAMIPSGYKQYKVYSVLPTDGGGDLTFERTTPATRVNSSGFIESVELGKPRLDYSDGSCPSLLLEQSSTNLITSSDNFSQWTKNENNGTVTILSSTEISPKGSADAYKVEFALNDLSTGDVNLNLGTITGLSGALTISYYLKADTPTQIMIRNPLNNGVYSFIDITTEWKRYELSTSTSSTLFTSIGLRNLQSNTNLSSTVYISAAQLEQQSYATSYIPTAGAIASRAADYAYRGGLNAKGIINDSAIVLYIENDIQSDTVNSYRDIVALYNDSFNAGIRLESRDDNGVYVQQSSLVTSGQNFNGFSLGVNSVNFKKIAVYLTKTQFKVFADGVQVGSTLNGAYVLNFDNIGFRVNDQAIETVIKSKDLRIYNTSLTDAELTILTTL